MIISIITSSLCLNTYQTQAVQSLIKDKDSIYAIVHSNVNSPLYRQFQKLQQVFKGYLQFGAVNSQDQTIVFYGTENPLKYQGQHNFQAIAKFLKDSIQVLIDERSVDAKADKANSDFIQKQTQRKKEQFQQQKKLKEKTQVKRLNPQTYKQIIAKSKGAVLINLFIANCSQSRHYQKQLQKAALDGITHYVTGKINCTQYVQFCDQFRFQTFPKIIWYASGNKEINNYVVYQQKKSNTGFFFMQFAIENAKKTNQQAKVVQINKQLYNKVCRGQKSICFILFSNDNQLRNKLQLLHKTYSSMPINLFFTTLEKQSPLAQQFQIKAQPAMLFIHGQRKRYQVVQKDSISGIQIQQKIAAIMAGQRNNFKNFKFDQNVS